MVLNVPENCADNLAIDEDLALEGSFVNSNHETRLLAIQVGIQNEVDKALSMIEQPKALSTEISKVCIADHFEVARRVGKQSRYACSA